MEPLSGFAVVAGVAGVTKVLTSNVDRIVRMIDDKFDRSNQNDGSRVVIVATPPDDTKARLQMDVDK